ncbi:hypothetical protein MKX03_027525 [Papaver bracteatum]|nr:hypothetical protein MKX03_027525 [Papaver bracteatum]
MGSAATMHLGSWVQTYSVLNYAGRSITPSCLILNPFRKTLEFHKHNPVFSLTKAKRLDISCYPYTFTSISAVYLPKEDRLEEEIENEDNPIKETTIPLNFKTY